MGLFNKVRAYEDEAAEININIEPGTGDSDVLEETKTDTLINDVVDTVEELEADGVDVSNAADAMDQLEDKNEQITEILADDPSVVTDAVANMAIESVAMILTRLDAGKTPEAITRNTGLAISQESYQSAYDRLVITNESISGTIRNIIQKIKVIFEKIKSYISKLISKVKIGFVRLTGRLDRLKSRLSKAKDTSSAAIASSDARRIAKKLLFTMMANEEARTVSTIVEGDIDALITTFKGFKTDNTLKTVSDALIAVTGTMTSKSIAELKADVFANKVVVTPALQEKIVAKIDDFDASLGDIACAVANGLRFVVVHAGSIADDGTVSEMPVAVSYKSTEDVFNAISVSCPGNKAKLAAMISGMQTATKNFDKYIKDIEEKVVTPMLNSLNKLSKINVDDIDGKQESDALEKIRYVTKFINLVGTTLSTAAISGRTTAILGVIDYIGTCVSAFEDNGKKK